MVPIIVCCYTLLKSQRKGPALNLRQALWEHAHASVSCCIVWNRSGLPFPCPFPRSATCAGLAHQRNCSDCRASKEMSRANGEGFSTVTPQTAGDLDLAASLLLTCCSFWPPGLACMINFFFSKIFLKIHLHQFRV